MSHVRALLGALAVSGVIGCGSGSDSSPATTAGSTGGASAGSGGSDGAGGSGTGGASAGGTTSTGGTSSAGTTGQGGSTSSGGSTSNGGASVGGSSPEGGGGTDAGGSPSGGSGGGAAIDGCTAGTGPLGDSTQTLMFGGEKRSFVVHVPPSYVAGTPTPVVLMFHGLLGTPSDFQSESQMNPVADAKGYLAVYPAGLSMSWNAGACCGSSASNKVDDVDFAGAVIDALEAAYCVDPKRVFAAGMSNGGMFSQRLACELSDRIAAIGPVAGPIAVKTCEPARPVPVLEFHGTSDPIVPYAVDGAQGTKNVPGTVDDWAMRNGCTDEPTQVYQKGDATCMARTACSQGAAVELCTIDGGGHQWPGGNPLPLLGKTSTDISASSQILDFFDAHPMP